MGRATAPEPPSVPSPGAQVLESVSEALRLSERVRAAVVLDSNQRLVAVRAYSDRLAGLIEALSRHALALGSEVRARESHFDASLSASASASADRLIGRGLAAEERRWRYATEHAGAKKELDSRRLALEDLEAALRFLRYLDGVFERHRLEALSLANRKATITAHEYHYFGAEDPLAGIEG